MNFSQKDIDRFWSKVDKKGEDECWNWTGCLSQGYGTMGFPKKSNIRAHRISLFLHTNIIPIQANHKCNNRLCCNPNHLYNGTQKNNMEDLGRSGTHSGENNTMAKLTEEQVREIRQKYIPYKYSSYKLAKEYNVVQSTIYDIINNKSWKDVR